MKPGNRARKYLAMIGFAALAAGGLFLAAPTASAATGPQFAVGDASVVEGDAAFRSVSISVTLSEVAGTTTVKYAVDGGTASAGSDFTDPKDKTLTFSPGTVKKFITVKVLSDTAVEGDEQFTVTLSNATGGAGIERTVGTGTIIDDDPTSGVEIGLGDGAVSEGDSGGGSSGTQIKFPVTLSTTTGTVTAKYSTSSDTASAGTDFKALVNKTLTFKPGQYKKFITVNVTRDIAAELDETFHITLTDVVGANVGRATGTGTIVGDDPISTTTSLTSGPNPSAFSDPVTLTATVASVPGTPTGDVEFFDGVTSLGTATLSGGSAELETSSLSTGTHSLHASYLGEGLFQSSTSAGHDHAVSGSTTGPMFGWGANSSGRLGDGTTDARSTPTQIGSDVDWKVVSAGVGHTMAIKGDGTLWGWGSNNPYGQTGGGVQADALSPVQIGSDADWASVSAGYVDTVAIKTNGELWAWGDNSYGTVGDSWACGFLCLSPVHVGTATWISATAGASTEFVAGIQSDGSLWMWGESGLTYDAGLCGGTFRCLAPVRVGTDNDWTTVSGGSFHTLALKANGTLWAWGDNGAGQVGDGTTTSHQYPVQVGTDTDWKSISAGRFHSAAVKVNGTAWTWGGNAGGELGHPATIVPGQVGSDTNWALLSAGFFHTDGLRTNGELWAWGDNSSYQFGNGSNLGGGITPVHIGTAHWLTVDAGAAHTEAIGA